MILLKYDTYVIYYEAVKKNVVDLYIRIWKNNQGSLLCETSKIYKTICAVETC